MLFWLTCRRDHAWCDAVGEYTSQIVDKSSNGDGLVAKLARRRFCHDGVADWANRDHVGECGDDKQNANSQFSVLAGAETKTTNRDKTEEHEAQSAHVDGCSTKAREQEPTDDSTDDVASRQCNVQVECCDRNKTCGFEEDDTVAKDCIPTEDLSSPDNTVLLLSANI